MADKDVKDTPRAASEKPSSGGKVMVRVTKFGSGKVSTGEHEAASGDLYAQHDELLEVDKSVADSLEGRGFAEIV